MRIVPVTSTGVPSKPNSQSTALRFSAQPSIKPEKPAVASKQSGWKPWKVVATLLGLGYAGASVGVAPDLHYSVTRYPGGGTHVAMNGKAFVKTMKPDSFSLEWLPEALYFKPPFLSQTDHYEMRDQGFSVDVEGPSKDGQWHRIRVEVPTRWDSEKLSDIDATLDQIPAKEKDKLYLHNWGAGGTDTNAIVYFAHALKKPIAQHVLNYIQSKPSAELAPGNQSQVWLELFEGTDGQPGLKEVLEKGHPVQVESLRVYFEALNPAWRRPTQLMLDQE